MNVALAIMRLQPLHEGHKILINEMLKRCDEVIIGVGSTQESKTEKNPFTYEERKKMLKDAFKDKIKIIPLIDIGAKTKEEWVDYVLCELKKYSLPTPTHYFSGSKEDANWYNETNWEIVIIDRYTVGKGISGTEIRKTMRFIS
jgi:cytidyltransferase-like protein